MNEIDVKYINGGVCAPEGFVASGMQVGISHKNIEVSNCEKPKKQSKKKNDLGLIYSRIPCQAAAVYTQNKVKGAPICITQKNLHDKKAQAIIVNSKNANTCNFDGEIKASKMCQLTANALHIKAEDVIVASTGVIGQILDISPIEKNIISLASSLSKEGSDACANAIMTTDLRKKQYALEFMLEGKKVRIGGIAKGSGMIHPNMATMLCFLTSDVNISSDMLETMLKEVSDITFNRISVDGDTSTNDMACILANGLANNTLIESKNESYEIFKEHLFYLMRKLAKDIARDGEGASKLIECICKNAPSEQLASNIAKSVITSSLVKTAMFGSDANWGRILCAIGYCEGDFLIDKIDVNISSKAGNIELCKNGSGVDFSEALAKDILLKDEIQIHIDLNCGSHEATVWGCDLSYDYVKINGDYRS